MADATEKDVEETTKKDTAENVGPPPLTSTIHLLALPCIFAILSGTLLHFSYFFGGSIVLLFVGSVGYALFRIGTVEKLNIKTLEIYSLGLCIALLATLSAISALPEIPIVEHLPTSSIALNMMLIALIATHLALWCRMCGQLNQCVLLGYSFTLIVASVIGTGFIWGRWGWKPQIGIVPSWLPTCVVIAYALAPFVESTFRLRDKLPISTLESAALLTSFMGFASCIASYYHLPALLPGLILATILCSTLYAGLDFLEHQMRTPHAQWTEQTETRSVCHVAIKALPLLTIICWAGMGAFGSWAIKEDELERIATCGEAAFLCRRERKMFGLTYTFPVVIVGLHGSVFGTIQTMREQMPPLLKGQKFSRKSFYSIAAVIAILLMKLSIACYYLSCPHANVPAWVALTIIGSLSLLAGLLLDSLRAPLLRYNITLLLVSIGLGIYLFATGIYLFNTQSEDDAPKFLDVFTTGVLVCGLLVMHFGIAISEQDDKKKKFKKNPAFFSKDVGPNGVISTSETV